jgi:hypothetical protein
VTPGVLVGVKAWHCEQGGGSRSLNTRLQEPESGRVPSTRPEGTSSLQWHDWGQGTGHWANGMDGPDTMMVCCIHLVGRRGGGGLRATSHT